MPRIYSTNYLNPCTFEGCQKLIYAKGLCRTHYSRVQRNGDLVLHRTKKPRVKCSVPNCQNLCPGELCIYHMQRKYKTGSATTPVNQVQKNGYDAEYLVSSLFRARKHQAKPIRGAEGDLLINGIVRTEVKCSKAGKRRGTLVWRFNIHRHGILNEKADCYIFRFEDIPYSKQAVHAFFFAPIGKKVLSFELRGMIRSLSPHVRMFEEFVKTGVLPVRAK